MTANQKTTPYNVNVMVDVTFVMDQLRPIVLLMEAQISNGSSTEYSMFDRDGAFMRWFEALDHYLAFLLGNQRANIGFDYYVNEFFAGHARWLQGMEFLRTGSIYFANAAGYLQRCLMIAQQQIETNGAMVAEVHSVPQRGYILFTYLVTGYYENHLLESDALIGRGALMPQVTYG